MKIASLILMLIFVTTCSSNKNPFKKYDFSSGDYDLYFYQYDYLLNQVKDQIEDTLIYGFKIENDSVVKDLLKSWSFSTFKNTDNSIFYIYKLELAKDNETYLSRSLDASLTKMTGPEHFYNFDKQQLFKYKNYFKSLQAFDISFNNRDDAIRYMKLLQNSDAYLPMHNSKHGKFNFEDYTGTVTLGYPTNKIPKSTENTFEYLKNIIPFEKEMIKGTANYEKGYIEITLMLNPGFEETLPADFEILQPFQKLKHITYRVLNLSESELLDLAKDNGIQIITIDSVNI